MRWSLRVLMMAIALGGGERALAQAPIPELRFVDPPGFYRSAIYPPADFSSTEVNASLQVYPFRPVNGDVRQAFSRTLLRELVDARYQETNVVPGASIDAFRMPGADIVLRARFREVVAGQPHERMRMAVVVGTAVAILDATANSMASWQRIMPRLNAFSATLQVVAEHRNPSSLRRRRPLVGRSPDSIWAFSTSTTPSAANPFTRRTTTSCPPTAGCIAPTTSSPFPETTRRGLTSPGHNAPIQ